MSNKVDFQALATAAIDEAENTEAQASESKSSAMNTATGKKEFAPTRTLTLKQVNPAKCRVWSVHDRDQSWFNPQDCADLIAGFKADGQQKPAVVRKITGDPNYDYEIIEGARRRWTAEHLGMSLEVEVKNLTDAQAAISMESENADRKDISAIERARSYARLLEAGVFSNQESLCEGMKVTKGNLSKSLKAATILTADLISARIKELISDIREISIASAYKLMGEWDKSEEIKGAIILKADEIQAMDKKPAANKILKMLAEAPYTQPKEQSKAYFHSSGAKVLSAKKGANGGMTITINKPGDGVKKADIKKLLNEAFAELM